MTIREFSAGPMRHRVAFVRVMPDGARHALERRGYQCYLLDESALEEPGQRETTDSVVITQRPDKISLLWKDLELFSKLLNFDCRLYVRHAPDRTSQLTVLDALNKLQLPPSGFDAADAKLFDESWFEGQNELIFGPFVHIFAASDDDGDTLANLIVRNPAGRPPRSDLAIEICDAKHEPVSLSDECELLVRRAFWDCTSIRLVGKTNGLSGVGAYEVLVHLGGTLAGGTWPYRYFVKLGDRLKVAREFDKYRTAALDHVPYHLGPRLRLDRCVLGRSQGLIVSDYVAGAEPIRDCARDGRSLPVIGNLFNVTLLAWRRAAQEEQRPLHQFLGDLEVLHRTIPQHRESLLRAYGATRTPDELTTMIMACSSQPVLTGVIHGDLHATNVLVRMNDAVIIDLERVRNGMPLLFDAASLEGGLFVDGFINDRRSATEVLTSIEPLYSAAAFDHDDHHCHPSNGSAWFVDAVRQIRMQARQMERQQRQYGCTLAAVLLKKACNSEDFRKEGESNAPDAVPLSREAVRALAYVLAERILVSLSTVSPPPTS